MKRTIFYISFSLVLVSLFILGCSDRGVNYDRNPVALQKGGPLANQGAHVFYPEFAFQISNRFSQVDFAGYSPKVTIDYIQGGSPLIPVPLLILLPPQDGDAQFYLTHGLLEIADELISTGEIQPMTIVCMQNDQVFGGYFYAGNTPAAGYYDNVMDSTLVKYIRDNFAPTSIPEQQKLGIGGIGMGAYGAYRTAIRNPGMFGSVSGVAGPMDFDGSAGNPGLDDVFDDALMEQGLLNQSLYDTANARSAFVSRGEYHLSRLFIGGAYAFSPYDTMIFFDTVHNSSGDLDYDLDSVHTLPLTVDENDTANQVLNLTIAQVPGKIRNNNAGFDEKYRFILPFNSDGSTNLTDTDTSAAVYTIWDRWLANNLETLLAASPNSLDGVDLMIANSPEAQFANYYSQTESWINTIEGTPYNLNVTKKYYSGYDGYPAQGNQYVYELIKEMLIFHSESFGD